MEQNVVRGKNDKKVSLLYYILPFKFWLSLRTDIAVCNNFCYPAMIFLYVSFNVIASNVLVLIGLPCFATSTTASPG